MAVSSGLGTCAKVVLFIFNFIFWICGLGIIAVGIWMKADPYIVNQFAIISMQSGASLLTHASSIIIAVGCFIMIFGFLGCCGALRESFFLLTLYASALVIVMLLQLVVGILAFVYRNRIEYSLRSSMTKQIQNDYMYDNNIGRAWNFVQVRMQCCGSVGPIDYKNSKWAEATGDQTICVPKTCCTLIYSEEQDLFKVDTQNPTPRDPKRCQQDACGLIPSQFNHSQAVPKSCCVLDYRSKRNLPNIDPQEVEARDYPKCLADARGNSSSSLYLLVQGCYVTILDWVKRNATILIGLGLGIGLIQIIGLVCAILMIMRLRLQRMMGENKPKY